MTHACKSFRACAVDGLQVSLLNPNPNPNPNPKPKPKPNTLPSNPNLSVKALNSASKCQFGMLYLVDQDSNEAWRVYEAGQPWDQAHPKRWSLSNQHSNPLVRNAIVQGIQEPQTHRISVIDSGEYAGILPLYHGALAAPLIGADQRVFGAVELVRYGIDEENCAEAFTSEDLELSLIHI